ncbi:MAG: hypothetical protein MUP85_23130 [Candidatus Lokiarchaeota archaeon]|jgi:hypothetical protein|nr:hypothetical protein [Candidatus Lokiarchaeota archaeon]
MEVNSNVDEQKKKISTGLIITRETLNQTIFPEEIKVEISKTPYYLLIFISREDVIKISCFPTKTNSIKKILIKLEEFSPEIVKGISEVLNKLNLIKDILHTTGICYELENCFYETYLIGDLIDQNSEYDKKIEHEFITIPRVSSVVIEDIPTQDG